jgi:signal transduction histidine kinase
MMGRLRERVRRWVRGSPPELGPYPLLFTDHEQIRDIARQMLRSKVELDRSVLALRSWARDLNLRLEASQSTGALDRAADLRALGETVGGLAHNFNNSLAAILAYTELMLREVHGETTLRRLEVIREVALEASVTVRRLQEFFSRQPQVAIGPVGLPAVITEALEMTAPRWRDEAQRRGVLITVTQDMEAIPPVEGNAFELRDALVHLILNAVAAMPAGGTLGVRAASEESGGVVLEVSDTGVGMPEEVRRRAAERPGRGGTSERGAGLDEVADIVERHGGSLAIESEPGKGTTVRLRLHASRFQIIPPPERMGAHLPTSVAPARILLVDDDPRLLEVLSDMLRREGHAVTVAASGEEALRLFEPAAHDLVITDLGMPRTTGWEVAEQVKARSADTPVFLLTGWGESVAAHEASRFVDRVIAKPISAEALLGQLAELRRPRASAQ